MDTDEQDYSQGFTIWNNEILTLEQVLELPVEEYDSFVRSLEKRMDYGPEPPA